MEESIKILEEMIESAEKLTEDGKDRKNQSID